LHSHVIQDLGHCAADFAQQSWLAVDQFPAQVWRGLEERGHDRAALCNVLHVLAVPLLKTGHCRHVARQLPRQVQISFDFIGGGCIQHLSIHVQFGAQRLVSPLKRENVVGCMRRIQEPLS
jgi:hypothetical protein